MITETDLALAKQFLPAIAAKKDVGSINKIKGTAKAIGAAMLPERKALMDLVQRITEVGQDPSFKAVFAKAREHNVLFTGLTWKEELAAARAIVDTYPVPEAPKEDALENVFDPTQ